MSAANGLSEQPPKFVYGEVVRVVKLTGRERAMSVNPLDAQSLIGCEAIVVGAEPTAAQDGWAIQTWVESVENYWEFAEEALETTGEVEVEDDEGPKHRRPLDRERDRWRDDVLLTLTTETTNAGEANAIAERAAATLSDVPAVDEVTWRLTEWKDGPFWITVWVWSGLDALEAFRQIIDLAGGGWQHDENGNQFVTSLWMRGGDSEFLAPGVVTADVSYRRWTSPRRRSRQAR